MFRTYALFLCMFVTVLAFCQNTFTKYENMDGVSSMVMDSNMFRLLSQIDFNSSDPETKAYLELVENIENVKVFSSEKSTIRQDMKSDVKAYLQDTALEKLITSNDNNQHVALYAKPSEIENHVSELLIFLEGTTESDNQNTIVVSITGNIDLKQVFKLAKDLDIPGNSTLKKLGD